MQSLLPLNATPLENAIDIVFAQKLDIDLSPIDINPNTCAEQLLPFLAAEWRVDISDLSIPEQRRLIANALEIHRYKGTVHAVEQALDVVFDDAQLVEYERVFEFDASVHLKADANAIYDSKKFTRARKLINQAKNGRSRFISYDIHLPNGECGVNQNDACMINPTLNQPLTITGQPPVTIQGAIQWML